VERSRRRSPLEFAVGMLAILTGFFLGTAGAAVAAPTSRQPNLAIDAAPSPFQIHIYGLENLDADWNKNGLRGFIRAPDINLSYFDPDTGVMNFLDLSDSTTAFVQIGAYQGQLCGSIPCITAHYHMHMYWEMNSCNNTRYNHDDLGVPPSTNYDYFINWNGSFNDNDCGSYYFPIRVGSWSSQPVGTGRLHASEAFPQAATEIRYLSSRSPEGIDPVWFGLNNNNQADNNYGLHFYNRDTGNWTLWTNSQTDRTTESIPSGITNPLDVRGVRDFDGFRVIDSR
jgi:hypothetical protein